MGDFSLDLRAVLTIISIVTAITLALIFQWWRNRKRFSYQILSNTALLTADGEIRDKLQILYEGQAVVDVRLFVIRFINNGKQPIDDKDFREPIIIEFDKAAKVLSVEQTHSSPENLKAIVNRKENKIEIQGALFNSDDFIEIKVIVSTYSETFNCNTRIIGIKQVQLLKEDRTLIFLFEVQFIVTIVVYFSSVTIIRLYSQDIARFSITEILTSILAALLLVIYIFYKFITKKRH